MFIAQSVHEHVLYDVTRVLSVRDNIVNMTSPSFSRPIHAVYIDDLGILSPHLDMLTILHPAVVAAYARVGLPVKMSKVVEPTSLRRTSVDLLGMLFMWDTDHLQYTLSVSPVKLLSLIRVTLNVLRIGAATGIEIAKLVGSWSWAILLRRPAFAVFQHVYRYALTAGRKRYTIWPAVKRELLQIVAIAPLLRSFLSSPLSTRFVTSDASSTDGGVVATDMTPHLLSTFWPMYFGKQLVTPEALEPAPPLPSFDTATHQPCRVATPQWASTASPYLALKHLRWATIISTQWKHVEHINALELRALLLEIQWIITLPNSCSVRLFALIDSAVAFYTVRKGRSSSPALLIIIRKINTLLLAADISLLPMWVPSEVNPADAPSRS